MPQYVELNFPNEDANQKSWAIWETGFRPFFLGGALFAALSLLVWLAIFFTPFDVGGPFSPTDWHAREMLFGFVPAIIAGFLLTAVPRWTGVETPTGKSLVALFALWVAGRLAMVSTSFVPYEAAAVIDTLFLPALAVAIAIPILRAQTIRNLGFIPILGGLAGANVWFHLGHFGAFDVDAGAGLDAAVGLIIAIIAVVGGRVIPFFAASALGGDTPSRRRIIDIVSIASIVAWLFALLIAPTGLWTAVLALIAGGANLVRMAGWKPIASLRVPLMWVLQAGYLFVGAGLVVYGLAGLGWTASTSIAIHLLTVGAMGTLCLGMMARVSLGHTGRDLSAPVSIVAAFGVIIAAAVTRSIVPWIAADLYAYALIASGVLWAIAWGIFCVVYAPILSRPRADGRPG